MDKVSENYRWTILAVVTICMISYAFVFQSIPPLLSLIIPKLKISYSQAGLLMGLFVFLGIFLSIPGGLISDNYSIKQIGSSSFILMIIGMMIVAMGESFFWISMGRFIAGLGGVAIAIITPQILSLWFMGKEMGIAMGLFQTAFPIGALISFNVLGRFGKTFGWQTSIFLTVIVCAIALLSFAFLYREPLPSKKTSGVKILNQLSHITKLSTSIWLVGLAWLFFNASLIGFLTFGLDFFLSRGFDIGYAAFLTSLPLIGALIVCPLVGYFIDRIGGKEIFIALGSLVTGIALLLIPTGAFPYMFLLVIIAIFSALVPPSVLSLPSDILSPQTLGLGFGIIATCLNIGAFLGPYLVGLVKDKTGSYEMSFVLMSLFALSVFMVMLVLKRVSVQPSAISGQQKNKRLIETGGDL